MGSSKAPDHSLGSGLSLPQWMKGKVDSRFDFDNSSFSPPSHDDSFFYIKFTKSSNSNQQHHQEGFRSINSVLNEPKVTNDSHNSLTSGGKNDITSIKDIKDVDFSKHPLPCQPFVPIANKEREAKTRPHINKSQTKSQGTDDGFHGEPALCGKSIVHVANRIMLGNFNKKSDNQGDAKMDRHTKLIKEGSRSLPVSPITSPTTTPEGSPKSRRRGVTNRYFTGAFIPDRDKHQSGWLLSSILSQSREIVGNKIEEEEEVAEVIPHKPLNRKKSISSQNLLYFGKDDSIKPGLKEATVTFQAKPSELREMNFWSPTSM